MSDNSGFMISGEENVRNAALLALRSALKLEIHGMRRSHGRPASVIANEITGNEKKGKREAYKALNAHIVEKLGETFNKPLKEGE